MIYLGDLIETGPIIVINVTFSKIKSFESLPQSIIRERLWTQHGKQEASDVGTRRSAGVESGPPLSLLHMGVLRGMFVDSVIRFL